MPNELNWTAAEDALFDWITAAIPSAPVDWAGQDQPQSEGDLVSLAFTSYVPVGSPSTQIHYDPARDAAGEGIELRSGGPAALTLQISVETKESVGVTSAFFVLVRALSRLQVYGPEREALRAAGVTVSKFGSVSGLPVVEGSEFEGRAVLEAVLYVQDFASAFTTWIEKFQASGVYTP